MKVISTVTSALFRRGRSRENPELAATHAPSEGSMVVHELVDQLGVSNPRQAEVANLRGFLEMPFVEVA